MITMCNAIITDPPYSPKTHSGFLNPKKGAGLGYESIDEQTCIEFIDYWVPRVKDWFVIFGDHISAAWWREALARKGLYVFAPVYYINKTAPPRMNADGPQSSGETITRAATKEKVEQMYLDVLYHHYPELFEETVNTLTIARPRYKPKTLKSRPGFYLAQRDVNTIVQGQKSLQAMCKIIDDYTDPYDIVIDPFAGSGTTLVGCKMKDRSCIGTEVREEVFKAAKNRVDGKVQMVMI